MLKKLWIPLYGNLSAASENNDYDVQVYICVREIQVIHLCISACVLSYVDDISHGVGVGIIYGGEWKWEFRRT